MLIRSLIALAARRVVNDPRVKAKARQMAETHAKPVIEEKIAEVRQIARDAEPGTHPARVAGRALKKMLDG